MVRRSTYNQESSLATRLRGTGGVYRGGDDLEANMGKSKSSGSNRNSGNIHFHKVQKGETLSAIARKRRTSVSALCSLNGIKKTVTLKPGMILKYN
jgi:LysM repeat protein